MRTSPMMACMSSYRTTHSNTKSPTGQIKMSKYMKVTLAWVEFSPRFTRSSISKILYSLKSKNKATMWSSWWPSCNTHTMGPLAIMWVIFLAFQVDLVSQTSSKSWLMRPTGGTSKWSLILYTHMQPKMLTKVLTTGMALNTNISMEVRQEYTSNGIAEFSIIRSMRFYVSCFQTSDSG